ncbi:MAG: DegT/DnrJ/EryC1/StrS family aminotransferase [Elusimicrobia bacterium]|nr:DegT/DnrJ/EryC1/StrS family aminotransferase [Elusimicrobiota bacterium]
MGQALTSEWLGTGIYTRLFESRLAREVGRPIALATNSGTAALHLALKALGVEGGEVVTTPVTSVATNHAILYNSALPVFCDVEPRTGNIDPGRIEALLTPRTRAIVAVHLGHACDMDAILEIARRRKLPVVEDACACHAVGGFYKDRPLGSLGQIGAFSFGRFKGLSTLDGGALVFGRAAWRERLSRLRRLGHREDEGGMAAGPAGVEELGYHYRMNDLAAAIGLSQLGRRRAIQDRLDAVLARYREGLSGASFLEMPEPLAYSRGVRAYAAVKVSGGRRDALRRYLADGGVQVNDCLYPNHLYKLYKPYARSLPAAEKFCAQTLHLPFYPGLRDQEIDRVLQLVRDFRP